MCKTRARGLDSKHSYIQVSCTTHVVRPLYQKQTNDSKNNLFLLSHLMPFFSSSFTFTRAFQLQNFVEYFSAWTFHHTCWTVVFSFTVSVRETLQLFCTSDFQRKYKLLNARNSRRNAFYYYCPFMSYCEHNS